MHYYFKCIASIKTHFNAIFRLIVAGIAEHVTESYDNLKLMKELINFDALNQNDLVSQGTIVTYHLDKKTSNEYSGLGTNAVTYPCNWCDMPKKDFENDHLWCGGRLRTLQMVRDNAKKYEMIKANYKPTNSKPKPSSAECYSCEHMPLFDGPGYMELLVITVPGKLHFRLGIFNDQFDLLDEIFQKYKCTIRALDWSNQLGMTRGFQYGSKLQFNGRQCKTLLDHLDTLVDLLKKSHTLEICMPLVKCLEKYKIVEEKCFGMDLDQKFRFYIRDFANSYMELIQYVRSLDLKLYVTVKVHGVCVHVPQFFEKMQARGLNFGLAYYSEEVGETVHFDYDTYWVGKKYNRDLNHKDYATNLSRCQVHYASDHEGRPSKPKE